MGGFGQELGEDRWSGCRQRWVGGGLFAYGDGEFWTWAPPQPPVAAGDGAGSPASSERNSEIDVALVMYIDSLTLFYPQDLLYTHTAQISDPPPAPHPRSSPQQHHTRRGAFAYPRPPSCDDSGGKTEQKMQRRVGQKVILDARHIARYWIPYYCVIIFPSGTIVSYVLFALISEDIIQKRRLFD